MVGTRATGRSKTYRYCTCWTRARDGPESCDMDRINADHLDAAVLDSTATFFRTRHDLMADAATLTEVSNHINHVIAAGATNQHKTVVEALVSKITMTGDNPVVPTFRIPRPPPTREHDAGAGTGSPVPTPAVRALTHLVEVPGIEPGSSVASSGLLRAQFAVSLLGPPGHANKPG